MGAWTYLNLSTRGDPFDERAESIADSAPQLAYKYGIAPAWFALFKVGDLLTQERENDDGPYFEVALSTDIDSARKNLEHRENALSTALGDRWKRSATIFKDWLNNRDATHVQMYLTEYTEMFDDTEQMTVGIQEYLGTLDTPYHTGRKALFSRKPKVSGAWQDLLWPLKQYAKEPDGQNAWVIFGSSDELNFDPPST